MKECGLRSVVWLFCVSTIIDDVQRALDDLTSAQTGKLADSNVFVYLRSITADRRCCFLLNWMFQEYISSFRRPENRTLETINRIE
mmetsp:Transcript_15538/g.63339  ORF Transcript_15538/g.63339 Transcript_15538/m.63339 type:complete len:86 (-) Transcript_15538:1969-2226(-)